VIDEILELELRNLSLRDIAADANDSADPPIRIEHRGM
jgi:hypothetical protein